MAAQTATHFASHGMRDPRYDDLGSTPLTHRTQPGSPTLTNPDMILPDYDEPESLGQQYQSPLIMWSHAQSPDPFHDFSQAGYTTVSLHPITPILYGNGTTLSDIGEVTEAESTVGLPPRRNPSRLSAADATRIENGDGSPLHSSPTMGKKTLKKRSPIIQRERRLSIDSTSTIQTIDGHEGVFGDIDDSASIDDSNFQGDDEESLASEFADETAVQAHRARVATSRPGLQMDRLSSHSISERAEQILATAKRRLTTMEDNLNRARTFSYSSTSDGSSPSPGFRPSSSSTRDITPSSTPSHSRNVSDDGLHSSWRASALPQRSASALGAAGGYRQHLPLSRSADALGAKSSFGSMRLPLYSIDSTLEPVNEDEDSPAKRYSRSSSRYQISGSPAQGPLSDTGTARSASVTQMRDLQDQMQGLKGKISSLKEQAKQDSLKRRSLQGLRGLSPFTNAEGDAPSGQPRATESSAESSSPPLEAAAITRSGSHSHEIGIRRLEPETVGAIGEERLAKNHDQTSDVADHQILPKTNSPPGRKPKLSPVMTHHGHQEDDGSGELTPVQGRLEVNSIEVALNAGFADDVSESGDSMYHETRQEPGNISHEDREDAFDYEHFYLHSGMGTLSRQRMRHSGSSGSSGSGDSVLTTRGPAMIYGRRLSIDTTTSVDSFATAREGAESQCSMTRRSDDRSATPEPFDAGNFLGPSKERLVDDNGFGPPRNDVSIVGSESVCGSSGSESIGQSRKHVRYSSVVHRPIQGEFESTLHRPSVSSFESTGTNRSFPLVKRIGYNGGGSAVPKSESPEERLEQVSVSSMNTSDRDSLGSGGLQSPAIQTLSREDQELFEQVVASIDRWMLNISEARQEGDDHIHYQQKIAAAKKFLDTLRDYI